MKKLLLLATCITLSATAAQAEINVGIGINQPAYYEPVPVYYPTYRNDRHREYDWAYWHHQDELRKAEELRRAEAEWRDEHQDNGKHKGWNKGNKGRNGRNDNGRGRR